MSNPILITVLGITWCLCGISAWWLYFRGFWSYFWSDLTWPQAVGLGLLMGLTMAAALVGGPLGFLPVIMDLCTGSPTPPPKTKK